MLKVETTLGPSAIEGTGLFAGQDIDAGMIIWEFNARFDQSFTPDESSFGDIR